MFEVIAAVIPFAIAGSILFFAVASSQRALKAFAVSLENDPDVVSMPPKWGQARCQTRRAPLVDVVAAGGGKNNPRRWEATASAPGVGARTSVNVSPEGAAGALRELVGVKDVHTGDDDFDKAYTVRGGEPDVVRGIFASVEVKDAVRALFAVPASRFEIKDGGAVFARCSRAGMDGMQAKRVALALARLVDVLERHANAPPIVLPSALRGAGGGSTGAPVGVPIGSGR